MARTRITQALRLALRSAALALALCFLSFLAAPAFAETPEEVCVVCQVDEGATAPENVRATRKHGEHTVHFCSERCARIFEKNPHRYLDALATGKAPGRGSPGDSLFALDLPGGGQVSTPPT